MRLAALVAPGNENQAFDGIPGWALQVWQSYAAIELGKLGVNVIDIGKPSRIRFCGQQFLRRRLSVHVAANYPTIDIYQSRRRQSYELASGGISEAL